MTPGIQKSSWPAVPARRSTARARLRYRRRHHTNGGGPRDEHAALFARIRRWLRPNGLFVAALGLSDNPAGYEANWLGAPMFWSGYERHVTERIVAAAGLAIESATIETAEEDGDPVSFLWVEARRL